MTVNLIKPAWLMEYFKKFWNNLLCILLLILYELKNLYNKVKNYGRGIADFFGVILLKRRRIAGESVHFMGMTIPRNGRGRPFVDYIYICRYKHMYTDYIYICNSY